MARHFLTTLTRELDREGPRVRARISEGMIAEVRADAHRWLGESLLGEGHRSEAREQFLASLRVLPRQPRLLAFYASTFLPPGARDRLASTYRSLKRRLR